ncbi:hypothetical protein CCYA_CCYA20G4761 [Cyanidiococcus yangmingshanensis]|uniref:t-SNARE coiled-coil homology domain-containing protein n=1 Tax=Cyanidiococcus yangmingshanensis TaxID=2690220 RepID=A0A7J7ID44_9RHOD|nr:hypothetical protein F1559_002329 [Cyanidiococcus yangmingshanensis]KAK4533879.1 hypothetical protein CCYA_CCYA20G4761 [Cyanidiococcus yangmingshanensis]
MQPSGEDPFYSVKADVERLLLFIEQRLRDGSSGVSTVRPGADSLVTGEDGFDLHKIKTKLETDLWELAETVRVVRNNRQRFAITDAELAERERAVSALRSRLDTLDLDRGRLYNSRLPSLGPAERPVSDAVGSVSGTSRVPYPVDYAAQKATNRIEQENEAFLEHEERQQQLLVEQQDQDLDDMMLVVKRLGDMGLAIRGEALRHAELIDEVDTSMSTVRTRFQNVRTRLESLIRETGRERLCSLLGLFAVFVVLLVLVLYT